MQHPNSRLPARPPTDEVERILRGDFPRTWRREIRSRAMYQARKSSWPTLDLVDELESAGLLALWRAARLFDSSRGIFEHYARRAIRYAMLAQFEILDDPRYAGGVGLDEPEAAAYLASPAEHRPDALCEAAEVRRVVRTWISSCPPRLVLLFELMYVAGLTQIEVADRMGISQPRVSQYHQRLLALGREALAHLRAA